MGCKITQVSRIDGRLRVDAVGITPAFVQIILAQEKESAPTCERCGNNGGHRREVDSEILTLCDACEIIREYRPE